MVGYSLAYKYYTREEVSGSGKHSSLAWYCNNYNRKELISTSSCISKASEWGWDPALIVRHCKVLHYGRFWPSSSLEWSRMTGPIWNRICSKSVQWRCHLSWRVLCSGLARKYRPRIEILARDNHLAVNDEEAKQAVVLVSGEPFYTGLICFNLEGSSTFQVYHSTVGSALITNIRSGYKTFFPKFRNKLKCLPLVSFSSLV